MLLHDNQPPFTGQMRGTIWQFLTANKFRIELRDGQLVDAVMPDDLIKLVLPFYQGEPLIDRIGVLVEFRDRPAMHRIVAFQNDGFIGAPRTPRR